MKHTIPKKYTLVQEISEETQIYHSNQEKHTIFLKNDLECIFPFDILWCGESRNNKILVGDESGYVHLMNMTQLEGAIQVKKSEELYQILYEENKEFKITEKIYKSVNDFKGKTGHIGFAQKLAIGNAGTISSLIV